MILCPSCQHREFAGALFCAECGGNLIYEREIHTPPGTRGRATASPPPQETPPVYSAIDSLLTLHLLDSDQILPLAGRETFTLGRFNNGQPILPDVDLTPYNAYSSGVSRLHATIQIGPMVIITDLGSSNGTHLNDKKISPYAQYPIRHGDIITLGKMKIQVLIRQ